jgi:predicted ribosomally synthesized peptide with SipW-like signal peptide
MKKKALALILAVALLAVAVIGGTLAYLTDTEQEENTFTVGTVDIELYESTLHRDNDNATDEEIIEDAASYQAYLEEAGKNMVPGRWVRKAPYVKNTGKNAAFVRIIVTQSETLWNTTSMMEYTTAQQKGAIVASGPVSNGDGTCTMTYTYTEALQPGEMTYYAPIWQIQIPSGLDSDDLKNWAAAEIVTVTAEAIQAEGFDGYEAAFAAFDAQNP